MHYCLIAQTLWPSCWTPLQRGNGGRSRTTHDPADERAAAPPAHGSGACRRCRTLRFAVDTAVSPPHWHDPGSLPPSTSDDESSHARGGNVVDDSRGDVAGGRFGPQPFRARLPTCPWAEPACPSSAATDATDRVLLNCDDIRSLAHRVQLRGVREMHLKTP
jgi:hypothetical protein